MSEELTTEQRIAANLKAIREDVGMSQEQVATAMSERGYSWHQATVYKVENGGRQVQLGEADALAKVFDVPLDRMIGTTARAVASARLASLNRTVGQRRSELIAAKQAWEIARDELATAIDVNSLWEGGDLGPMGSPRLALVGFSTFEQDTINRRASESVEAVFANPDESPF